ncbi:cysteine desulfurase [Zhengella mangrovi]|uniref:Cysteine desulfurase n=1 Tax=Zhengella mangrovi TaxID=1982044 RepID=A0A2G1QRI3_9HYPH|nr:cysteine desulfurase family protein [Zhengella mangrovi]PHP68064.1 cysteine desulfurase [Zhengella mangrovi]
MAKATAYLDYNASAPLLMSARRAMESAMDCDANPSSVHRAGKAARRLVEDARRQVADLVGASAEHVVFTSGATEAATTLLTPHWHMGRAPMTCSHLYVLASDHPCLLSGGRFPEGKVTRLPVTTDGLADLDAMRRALEEHDTETGLPLVALHAANNETGVLQPLDAIRALVVDAGGLLVVDAVQAAGRVSIDIANGYADFVILSAHKLGGPRGVGACVARAGLVMPEPLVRGGGQERGHRAGTENVAGIAGFGAAAEDARAGLSSMADVAALRDGFEAQIAAILPAVVIHGQGAPRIANTSFVSLPGLKAETAQIALDLEGLQVSAGSACSSGKVGPSHVLEAMGADAGLGALRVSIGRATTRDELERLVETLKVLLARRKAA